MTTSFRPTAYRYLMVSGAWNAYLNHAWARKTSGEFILVMDDLCAEYQVTWEIGETAAIMLPKYLEDLEWLGLTPDRVEISSHNRVAHLEAAAKLGVREAWLVDGMRLWDAGRRDFYDPYDWGTAPMDGTSEGWIAHDTECWNPWYMACCVADDIEFGITGYVAGRDQEWYKAWCLDAYERLGHPAPTVEYPKVLKRQAANAKISKSVGGEPTIRALRRAGYEPKAIFETLRELTTRARMGGLAEVIIPHGVLRLDEVVCLRERNYRLEELAGGRFTDDQRESHRAMGMTEAEIDELAANIRREAQRRLEAWNAE